MPYTSVHDLLYQYQQRDFLLIVLLCVIGVLYWMTQRALGEYERFMDDHPGSKGEYKTWSTKRALAKHASRPTSVICPLHKVFRDTCPPGSHDEE